MLWIIYLIDAIFIADIALNFRTKIKNGDVDSKDKKRDTYQYLSTFFVFDLLANIPIVYSTDIENVSWLAILPVFRILRLSRLFRLVDRWSNLAWNYTSLLRILKFVIAMVIVIHWIASAWFLIARMDGFSESSWLISSGFIRSDSISDYIYSVYWTIITMTTVGYGDITPVRNIEYIFTMLTALAGASSYAFIIGNVVSQLNNLNAAKNIYFNKIQAINQYLDQRNLPKPINNKVRKYYEYLWTNYKGQAENNFLDEVPMDMRLDIMKHLAKAFLEKIPLFKNASGILQNELLLALKHHTYPPDCVVAQKGEAGREIFFIAQGELFIVTDDSKDYPAFSSGDYFGEMSLLLKENRSASVRTKSYCDLYCLNEKDYSRLKKEYPEFSKLLKQIMAENREKRSEFIIDNIVL